MQRNDIGLIVWGCKGGHRVFCSQGVDYRIKSINDTIKDIRSFVRFNLINLTTYAVEFTDNYKVFTIYRSCNDSGTGAYVAITLYVPHTLRVCDLRKSLDSKMDFYFKEFVHPVFGTYYDGKYDSIDQYNSFMGELQVVPEKELFERWHSFQDNRPRLRLYDTISEVDAFFESPYRKEFFQCQEVMFMSSEIYNQRPESLSFNFAEEIIKEVSEPERLPQLYIGDNKEVIQLTINGQECLITEHHPVNVDTDDIGIVMRRQYCKDLQVSGKTFQLIEQGKLIERNKIISIGNVSFVYETYEVVFTLNGQRVPEDIIYIQENRAQTLYLIKDSKVQILGNHLNHKWDIFAKPCRYGTNEVSLSICSFIPANNVDNTPKDVTLDKISFRVEVARGVSDSMFYIYLDRDIHLDVPISSVSGQIVDLYLPKGYSLSADKFDKQNPEIELSFENNVLTITSKELGFDIVIPDEIKQLIKDWDFCISEESRKKDVVWRSGFKIKIRPEEEIGDGKLYLNGEEYLFDESDGCIYPHILYIKLKNDSNNQLFSYKLCENDFSKNEAGNRIFPFRNIALADVVIDESLYLKSKTSVHSIVTIELERVKSTNSFVVSSEADIRWKLRGCNGLYINKKHIQGDEVEMIFKSSRIEITNIRNKLLCVVHKEADYYEKGDINKNKKNGFSVQYLDNGNILVQYKKPESAFIGILKDKLFLSVASLLLIVMCIGVLWLSLKPKPSISMMRIYVTVADDPNSFGDTINKIKIRGTKLLRSDIDDEGCYIDVIWNKDSADQKIYDQLLKRDLFAQISGESVALKLLDIDPLILNGIQSIKNVDKDFIAKKITIKMNSPIQTKIKEIEASILSTDSVRCVFEKYNQILLYSKNKNVIQHILHLGFEKLDTTNMSECQSFLNVFEQQKGIEIYQKVKKITEQLQKKNDEAKEEERRKTELINEFTPMKNLLHSNTCTIKTVKEVEAWWRKIASEKQNRISSHYNFSRAIEAYEKFFNATNCGQIQELGNYKSCFSSYQYKVIDYQNGYKKNKKTFDGWRGEMGMSFSKPYECGYINQ